MRLNKSEQVINQLKETLSQADLNYKALQKEMSSNSIESGVKSFQIDNNKMPEQVVSRSVPAAHAVTLDGIA